MFVNLICVKKILKIKTKTLCVTVAKDKYTHHSVYMRYMNAGKKECDSEKYF